MKSGYRFGVRLSLFWFFLILFFPSPAKAGPAHTEGPSQQTEWPPDPIPDNGFLWNAKERDHFVRVASGYLGWKYIRGGNSSRGVDCSALVQRVFRVMGIDLPRTAREQFQVGYKVAREALEIGDLVFFKRNKATRPTHVGIYLGDGRFIHASLK